MGKGFENFMMKKDFHPANRDNQKRIWMKEEEKKLREQKEADLRSQYAREQELFQNKQLLGNEKAKLGLSFMYEPPPGARKQDLEAKEAAALGQAEVKFEWQRKYNAPREDIAKGNEEVRDQPFGIEVRNVRCIKCHQWGHLNTQRICPMFGLSKEEAGQQLEVQAKIEEEKARKKNQQRHRRDDGETSDKTLTRDEILDGMEEDNLVLKRNAKERPLDQEIENERMIESDDDDMDEIAFIRNLTEKEKKKLMKKFLKLQNGGSEEKKNKKKKKKEKKRKSKKRDNSDDDDESDEDKRERDLKDYHGGLPKSPRGADDKTRDRIRRRSISPALKSPPSFSRRRSRSRSPAMKSLSTGRFKKRSRSPSGYRRRSLSADRKPTPTRPKGRSTEVSERRDRDFYHNGDSRSPHRVEKGWDRDRSRLDRRDRKK